ncbi:MAG: filamentous hemagglutinin family outer membrane protein, partial [Betaproteobacteria bacterium]|nr:filamentous hemagglutinin family outer membrane protein [Betaproteobacteria bacterium]
KDVTTANFVTVNATTLANGSNGGLASNYSLTAGQSIAANITPQALTATVAAPNKVYNGDNVAAPTLTITAGHVGSETVGASATASFNTKDVTTANLVTVNTTALADGSNGGLASNYSLAAGQAVATNITPKALSVSGITAADKVYDGGTAATVDTAAASLNGLVAGDAVNLSTTGVFADRNVGTHKSVALTSSYTGADVVNYTITGQAGTTADIVPVTLTLIPGTPLERVLNATTQLQSNVFPFPTDLEARAPSLSPPIIETQDFTTDPAADDEASRESGTGKVVNTTMNIGAAGSVLQIMNGGVKLPDNIVNVQQ